MINTEKKNIAKVGRPKAYREYAIYKGDEFITLGTAQECADKLGVKPEFIKWMTTPTCRKRNKGGQRMEAIIIEDDEEKEQR